MLLTPPEFVGALPKGTDSEADIDLEGSSSFEASSEDSLVDLYLS